MSYQDISQDVFSINFSYELELDMVNKKVRQIYTCLEKTSLYKSEIEDDISYLKCVLKETTKMHDKLCTYNGTWKDKLAVIHCRQPWQETFVTVIWDLILLVEHEFSSGNNISPDHEMNFMLNEVFEIGEECDLSSRCFPLAHLIKRLEIYSCEIGANPEKVQAALISLGVPFRKLYHIYEKMLFYDEDLWDEIDECSHLLKVFASLLQSFIRMNVELVDERHMEGFVERCQNDVRDCCDEWKDHFTPRLTQRYKRIEKSLYKMRLN